jgi:hypothetical protein
LQSRFHPMFYVILPLAALGLAYRFDDLVSSMVIPIVIVGVLFVLYFLMQKRRPTSGARYNRAAAKQMRRPPEKPKTKRSSPFRVIEGRKNRDEDEPPRYH